MSYESESIEVLPLKYPSSKPRPYYTLRYTYTEDTMSKHTSGTWTYGHGYVTGIGEVFGVGIQTEPDWTPICILSLPEKVNETDVANARLIAAAPELLVAAKGLLSLYESHGWQHPTINAARAAIAKAEKEQKP